VFLRRGDSPPRYSITVLFNLIAARHQRVVVIRLRRPDNR
jgi:hypothetical protein